MTGAQAQLARRPLTRQYSRVIPFIIAALIFVLLPLLAPTYIQNVMTKAIILAIFAMSLNILWGYTGLFSLGHAAYFGVAGYAAGILITKAGIDNFWIVLAVGLAAAIVFSAIFGIIALRVSGIYFLLVTFALGQLIVSIVSKWYAVTGGTDGLIGIPYPNLGFHLFKWRSVSLYFFVFLGFIICVFLMYRFLNSPFGYSLRGVRDDEKRMQSLGYNTWLHKYVAFIVAGTFAGFAGILYTYFVGSVSPSQVGILTSGSAALMCLIGGAGTLLGPLVGAISIVFVEFYASTHMPSRWPMILGGIFILSAMFLRGGISPYAVRLWNKIRSRARVTSNTPAT
jgi:branched-chain amino acid transport system permease protein